jgi:quercetin dioxygenase-like cupin family protein
MQLFPADARPSKRGPSEWFTGTVWIDELATCPAPAHVSVGKVTFEPGARTVWHTHPVVQVLHVLSGVGRIQKEGEPIQILRTGDTAHILAGEKHWHGAGPDQIFTHLAVTEALDGSPVTWLEPVSDEDYLAK